MIFSCLMVAFPFVADRLVERSDDPFTILWSRSITEDERTAFADALGVLDPQKAIRVVQTSLCDAAFDDRFLLALLMLEWGHADKIVLEVVEQSINDQEWGGRLPAFGLIMRLAHLKTRAAPIAPILVQYIAKCGPTQGGFEALILAQSGEITDEGVKQIVELLNRSRDGNEQSRGNRASIVCALGLLGTRAKPATQILESMMKEEYHVVATAAAVALLRISPGHGDAAKFMFEAIASHDKRLRVLAASLCLEAEIDSKLKVEILSKLLAFDGATEHELDRGFRGLAWLGRDAKPASHLVESYLKDQRAHVRVAAAHTLMEIGAANPKRAISVLIEALSSDDLETCRTAAGHCNSLKRPPAELLPGLRAAMKKASRSTMTDAAATILKIAPNDDDSRRAILKLLNDGSPERDNVAEQFIDLNLLARRMAAGVIAKHPASFPEARGELIKLLRKSEGPACRDIAEAVKAIDSHFSSKKTKVP